jgi:hypothetical protein
MRRQIIDILIILFLLVGAFFLYTYFFGVPKMLEQWTFHREEKSSGTYQDVKRTNEEVAKMDAQIYNTALKNLDTQLCKTIVNLPEQSRCHDMITATEALKNKDQEMCKTLSSTGIAERCRDNIVLFYAEKDQDRSKCTNLIDDTLRLECIETIDMKTLSARVASGTTDDIFCQSLAESLQKKCRSHVLRKKDNTLYQDTVSSQNLSDCDQISDTNIQAECHDSIILERAFRENDMGSCTTLINPEKMKYCQNAFNTRNEMTRYQSAISSGDILSCNNLQSESLRSQCHDTLIIVKVRNTKDTLLCQSLYNTGSIRSCEDLIPPQ